MNNQTRDFQRLGILGEWETPYLTMSPEYESSTARLFGKFLERGYVYKGLRPVYWCIHDQTALAEAEVEYKRAHFALGLCKISAEVRPGRDRRRHLRAKTFSSLSGRRRLDAAGESRHLGPSGF